MLSTTIKRTVAMTLSGAAIAVAVGAPAASAMPADPGGAQAATVAVDLRSPDARDGAAVDMRTPDAREGAAVDMRSPDAADAARGIVPAEVASVPSRADFADDPGFNWSTAGIAAAVLVGMLLAAAAVVGVMRQRSGRVVA